MKRRKPTCYRCGGLATTVEHIPPKCLFPEKKEFFGIDVRNNLLTVPSCHIHNTKKSKDDEYLMICLASSVKGNPVGYFHYTTKVKRAVLRNHKDFLNDVIQNGTLLDYTNSKGRKVPAIKADVKLKRLHSSLISILYGLFFYEKKTVFIGKIRIVEDLTDQPSEFDRKLLEVIKYAFENDPKEHVPKGNNPDIFQYQFTKPDLHGIIGCKLTFYEGIQVFGAFIPSKTVMPFNLPMELAKNGMKVVVEFGDKKVEFN